MLIPIAMSLLATATVLPAAAPHPKPHKATAVQVKVLLADANAAAYQSCVEPAPSGAPAGFQLSHAYPAVMPAPSAPYPWEAFDFTTQPELYAKAVLQYARADLDAVNWDASKVPTRWFHAPWMAFGPESGSGREYFHGMTKERTVTQAELVKGGSKAAKYADYAVGYYNDVAGWTFGQVFSVDPSHPDGSQALFANGACGVKLLFTSADGTKVPSLSSTLSWPCDVYDATSKGRKQEMVQLLQVDIAVRDKRNDARTGWVFGTFAYNGSATGTDPLDRLELVGLMWGNDPTALANGGPLTETWINTAIGTYQHLGREGRLNGPVDNPISSCLSCHSTAQIPKPASMTPPAGATDAQAANWFRNIPAGQPFSSGATPLDYSLQLGVGFINASAWAKAHPSGVPMMKMKAIHQFMR